MLKGPDIGGVSCLLNMLLAGDTQMLKGPDTGSVSCLLDVLLVGNCNKKGL